jgi:radical SAM superfamily enzyme YgiQ (UPF0313 family)
MRARGWEPLDIIIVSGDAFVDHPVFGPVMSARALLGCGFKVGIVPHPDGYSAEPFKMLGKPRRTPGKDGDAYEGVCSGLPRRRAARP